MSLQLLGAFWKENKKSPIHFIMSIHLQVTAPILTWIKLCILDLYYMLSSHFDLVQLILMVILLNGIKELSHILEFFGRF